MTGVGCKARRGRIQASVAVLDCKKRIGLAESAGAEGVARD